MAPPIPTTVETAVEGNMSVGVEKRFADQPWCAAAASAMMSVAGHGLVGKTLLMCGTNTRGSASRAMLNMANLRPLLTVWPRFIRQPESEPPKIDPTDETT